MIKRRLGVFVILFLAMTSGAFAVETGTAEKRLKEPGMAFIEENKKLNFYSDYEYGWVKLAGNKGAWKVLTNIVAYAFDNGFSPYLDVDAWDRFGDKNTLINAGSYFRFKDSSYLRSEIGFGKDATYLPKFQTTQEYQRRLFKDIFWQFGYRFLQHPDGDIHIVYPGLIYYFGNNSLSMFYNASFTAGRGSAQWGTLKGIFALNDRLNFSLGTAVGERLYDINLLSASKEYGYIIFAGFDLQVYKEWRLRLGYSYSREVPDFIKRSMDAGFSVKF